MFRHCICRVEAKSCNHDVDGAELCVVTGIALIEDGVVHVRIPSFDDKRIYIQFHIIQPIECGICACDVINWFCFG